MREKNLNINALLKDITSICFDLYIIKVINSETNCGIFDVIL